MRVFLRILPFSVIALPLAMFDCVGDSTAGPPDSGDASVADVVDATTDVAADVAPDVLEAGPPTPTGKIGWAADFGSPNDDQAMAVAIDAQGDVYVGGSFSGTIDFGNGKLLTSLGLDDAFIAKYDPKGTCLAVTRIGSATTEDTTLGLAVDPANGDVAAIGTLFYNQGVLSNPFGWSVNAGSSIQTKNGAFLVRLSSDLTTVKFAQDLLTNSSASQPSAIAVGPGGAVAIGGTVHDDASIPFGTINQPASGQGGPSTGFIAEYDSAGNFDFARILSALSGTAICETFIGGVAFDAQGNIVASGTAGGFDPAKTCNYTADYANNQTTADFSQNPSTFAWLLLRYDAKNGGKFAKATVSSRTNAFGYPRRLAIAPNGDAYAAFSNESSAPFTFGTGNVPAPQQQDGLVLHWDSNGAESSYLAISSAGDDDAWGVAVDPWGNVVVGGSFGADLSLGGKSAPFAAADAGNSSDGFVAKLDPTLKTCLWLDPYSNAGYESIFDVAVNASGTIAADGIFDDASLSVGNAMTVSTKGKRDGFVVSLAP